MAKFAFSEIMDGLPVVKVVDVGPSTADAGGEPYAPLMKRALARVIGFDANESDCAALNDRAAGRHLYLPYVIGDGGIHTFHVCRAAAGSSLCEPDAERILMFQDLDAVADVIERRSVATRRLDDVAEAAQADFLRVDAPGAALDVLAGAERLAGELIVVHITVDFVALYKDQPLFADIDRALRDRGFVFHKFTALGGRSFKPLVIGNDANDPLSQVLSADAVYVRDFTDLSRLPAEKLLKLAVVLHEVYGSYDLTALALKHFDLQTEGGLWPAYVRRLTGARTPRGSAFA
ncbi:MAG TPA: FkbM family methyltransferase [Alphaproteobacteria bacterium]|jgi:FkbM family methyltransferase